MEYTLYLKDTKEYMKGYEIVSFIYQIRDEFLEAEEKIEYDELLIGSKILDYIREVNFVFIKDVAIIDQIKTVSKVGNLMNFQVYLDPSNENTLNMFSKGKYTITIKIEF